MATYFDSSGVDLSGIVDGETIDANDVRLPLQALKDAVTDMDTLLGDGLVLDEQSTAPAAATGVIKLYVLGGKLYAKDANGQVYDLFSGGGTSTQAPIANAGVDQTVQDSDDSGSESIQLDGSGSSDGDGTIVSYVWTEGGSQIATGVNPTVNLAVGTHTITLTVTDNDNETATDTVVVTVNALSNQNPVANAGADQTVQDSDDSGSESIQLDGSGSSDGDGTIVSYVWTEGGSQIATGVNPTVNLAVGTHTITLTVTDDDSATATDTVVVTVNALANQAPVANAGVDQTVQDSDDSGSESVELDGSGSSDGDGTIVSYVWTEGGSQIATGVNPTVNLAVGTHTITLTVTDNDSATATDTVVITISPASTSSRVTSDLLALYEFNEGSGSTVADTSGVGTALDLTISNLANVSWGTGTLTVNSSTVITSDSAATKIINGVKSTSEVTLEAWIQSNDLTQEGPARVAGVSGDPSNRNITLGQGLWDEQPLDVYDMRLRTGSTNHNGTPSLSTPAGTATTNLMHVVLVHASDGTSTIYVNGTSVVSHNQGTNVSSWDTSFPLVLANEPSGDRPWLGTFHLVAVYDRALSSAEVQQNFNAGV